MVASVGSEVPGQLYHIWGELYKDVNDKQDASHHDYFNAVKQRLCNDLALDDLGKPSQSLQNFSKNAPWIAGGVAAVGMGAILGGVIGSGVFSMTIGMAAAVVIAAVIVTFFSVAGITYLAQQANRVMQGVETELFIGPVAPTRSLDLSVQDQDKPKNESEVKTQSLEGKNDVKEEGPRTGPS